MRFETPGFPSRSWRTSVPESVTADLIFFSIVLGGSRTRIVPWGESSDFDILFSGCCRSMTRAPTAGKVAFGTTKVSPKRLLNRMATSRGELHVLALVVADRHLLGVVQHDVGHHEHGVVEEPDAQRLDPVVALLRELVLELGHAAQLAERRHAVEQPGELGVGAHVTLHEQQRPVAAEPGRGEQRGQAPGRRRRARPGPRARSSRAGRPRRRWRGGRGRRRIRRRAGCRPSAAPRRGSCRGACRRWV